MPLAIAAAVDSVAVLTRLTVTGATAPVTITASPTGRDDYELRGPFATSGSSILAVDPEAPFGLATVYVVTDATGAQAASAAVTLEHDSCVLSDATDPSRFADVVVVSSLPGEYEARSTWWDILGRSDPFVTIAPMSNKAGDLVLRVEDVVERRALLALLLPGTPLILRSPTSRVDDVTVLPERVSDELVVDGAHDGPHNLRVRVKAVSRQLGPVTGDPARTWQSVIDENATWGDVLADYSTWADVLTGDRLAGLSAEKLVDGDFSSGLTSWNTFWSSAYVGWSGAANTARAEGLPFASVNVANLRDTAMQAAAGTDTITPGTVVRVTGRVRVAVGSVTARVTMLTNNATGAAEFFAAGVAQQSLVVTPPGSEWVTFAAIFTVPAGHTRYSVQFRGEGVDMTDVIEWDDLSVRWRL